MEWVNNKFGRKITAIFGALVGIFGCLWMRYGCIPGDPSVQYHVFFVAILLGKYYQFITYNQIAYNMLCPEFLSNTRDNKFFQGYLLGIRLKI